MPGKNQQKRIEKRKAHARKVWAKKRLAAAAFWKALEEAEAQVFAAAGELTLEQRAEIDAKIKEQRDGIKDFLLKARDNFVAEVGDEDAEFGLDFDVL
jgi:hypothetical protein